MQKEKKIEVTHNYSTSLRDAPPQPGPRGNALGHTLPVDDNTAVPPWHYAVCPP